MTAGFSETARHPGFIALAAIAALGWIVASWSITSSTSREAQIAQRIRQLETSQRETLTDLQRLTETAGRVDRLEEQLATAHSDLDHLHQQQEQTVSALTRIRNETTEAERRLQEAREAQMNAARDSAVGQKELDELNRKKAEVASDLEATTAARDRLRTELQQVQNELLSQQQGIGARQSRSGLGQQPGHTRSLQVERDRSTIVAERPPQHTYRCHSDGTGWICSIDN